jgi:hypothetical protein
MQPPQRPGPPKNRIAAILRDSGLLSEEQLRNAQQQHEQWGGRLARHVTELGYASEEAVTAALAQGLRVPRVTLATVRPLPAVLARVPPELAEARLVLPLELRDGGRTLLVAMADPTDVATMDELARRTGARVAPAVAGDRELERAIRRHYHGVEESLTPPPTDGELPEGATSGEVLLPEAIVSGEEGAPTPVPTPVPGPAPAGRRVQEAAALLADLVRGSPPAPSAADVLEELVGGPARREGLTPEEHHRLLLVQRNQERSARVLRAVAELLLEKGWFTREELAARLRS